MLANSTINALEKHTEFFERAARFRGFARERMVALGEADELYHRLYPHHYRALQVIRVSAQLVKSVYRAREPLQRCESRTVALLTQIVNAAVADGALVLRAPQRPEELSFSMWALVFGTRALMNTAVATHQLAIEDAGAVARDTAGMLFDALGWRPLTSEWDYELTRRRVRAEIFEEEWPSEVAA
jgi:hypothetical protein